MADLTRPLGILSLVIAGPFLVYNSFFSSHSDESISEVREMDVFDSLRSSERIEELSLDDPIKRAIEEPDFQEKSPSKKLDKEPAKMPERVQVKAERLEDTSCPEIERVLGNCASQGDTGSQPSKRVRRVEVKTALKTVSYGPDEAPPEPQRVRARAVESSSPSAAEPKESGVAAWANLMSSEVKTLEGRSTLYPGEVIRAGCRVLGVIQDELMVSAAEEHVLTINVRGALDGCRLPPVTGLRLIGSARLNKIENAISASISTCSDLSGRRRSVACKAQVKSITGRDTLEGEIYDRSHWGTLVEFLMATGAAPVVGRLTETASTAKTLWGAHAAGQVATSLQRTVDRVAQKISRAFEGREINLARNATVIVTFTEDVAL